MKQKLGILAVFVVAVGVILAFALRGGGGEEKKKTSDTSADAGKPASAAVDITCPDRSNHFFLFDSAARAVDPIRVGGSGAFSVTGAGGITRR